MTLSRHHTRGGRAVRRPSLASVARTIVLAAAALGLDQAFGTSQAVAQDSASPIRTEIVAFDNWTVTCRDGRDPKEKRVCSAELNIFQEAGNARRVLFVWTIVLNTDNAPFTQLRFLPGITVTAGVDIKLANNRPVRKLPITVCEPTHCEASLRMDDAFQKDASAATQAEAVIQASDGRQVTFTINMKGFAQALAMIKK